MSDKVIRLGGSNSGDASSIRNLIEYLSQFQSRNFIVSSAVPELLQLVENNIHQVYKSDAGKVARYFEQIFIKTTGEKPSQGYQKLVEQYSKILIGIGLIGDYSEALSDQVKSFSEKLTVEIIKSQFEKIGVSVTVIWPEEYDFYVTSDFGNATYLSVKSTKLKSLPHGFYLIPGSYGITKQGKIARAGKTAADYTAAFLTYALKVPKLQLWGLDFDFQRADPAIVFGSPRIERLTYAEASELAYFDHYSFHPRTVDPLEHDHIPIEVLNSSTSSGKIDTIINTETYIEGQIVKSVACTDDISLLRLNGPGVGLKPGILAKVTTGLNDAGINIKSVITSQVSINLILEKSAADKALKIMQQPGFSSVKEISVVKNVSLIGVVGHGMQQNYGVSARIFNAVSKGKINVLLSGSGASDLVSYLVVKDEDKEKSVREIYNAFFNE
jgi:aspartate kinase/aspartokinase/homoserine dehydrogenase 1